MEEDSDEWFYRILNYLETKESIYGCLNTSLNRPGKPLVNDMKECFKLLDETEMAAIVIENKMYISNNNII